ncbi:MAG: hypothetical protein KDD56_10290, partial [Bdellovibrionales bacterium]|nr:hypothetical protein [Bdellovibrionales bacterium]
MSNKILAFAEAKDGKFKNAAQEVVTEAKKLAGQLGSDFEILVIGNGIDEEAKGLGAYGAKKVLVVDLNDLNSKSGNSGFEYSQSAFAKVISETAKSRGADIILMSATSLGRDLAPRVAIKNESAICPDCVDIMVEDGKVHAKKPVFAGKSYIKMKFNNDKIVLTLRPNVFKAEKTGEGDAEIEKLDSASLNVNADDFKSVVKETKVSSEKL